MGLYDTVRIQCKECKTTTEFQSKAGCCSLNYYHPSNAPLEILADLQSRKLICSGCKNLLLLHVQRSVEVFSMSDDEE